MVGASSADMEVCREILLALGKVFHVGEVGKGQKAKCLNQMLVSVNLLAVGEALGLAEKFEIDYEVFYNLITAGAGDSKIFRLYAPLMASRNFEGKAPISHLTKDTGIALQVAERLHLPLLFTSLAHQCFLIAESLGYKEKDNAAVIEILNRFAGISEPGQLHAKD